MRRGPTGWRSIAAVPVVAWLLVGTLSAQLLDAPARIVLLVDSSSTMASSVIAFREALTAFVNALPGADEIGLISTGGQLRVRVAPTTDRAKMLDAAAHFFSDGGANVFIDALLESDKRFLKSAPTAWPVFVIVTTDAGTQVRGEPNVGRFNQFVKDFVMRRGMAHAIVLRGLNVGRTMDFAKNLTDNTGGSFESVVAATSLSDKLAEIAGLIASDYHPRRPF